MTPEVNIDDQAATNTGLSLDELTAAFQQSADGKAHITYFDRRTQASFTWDGKSEQIVVAIGGYGEPVDHVISDVRLRFDETYAQLILNRFEAICQRHANTLPDYRSR